MRFIVSLAAVLTPLSVGAFAFLPAERTIAVPALAIASPRVAGISKRCGVRAAQQKIRPGGRCRNARSCGNAYTGGARKPGCGACRRE